jgi:hypothetical protein
MKHPHPLPDTLLRSLSTDRLLRVLKYARAFYYTLFCPCCGMRNWEVGGGYYGEAEGVQKLEEVRKYMKTLRILLRSKPNAEK